MNDSYSKTMKALLKKPNQAIRVILLILIIVMVLSDILIFLGESYEQSKNQGTEAETFDSSDSEMNYSQLTPQYLSDWFASDADETVYYCLAVDSNNDTCVVAIDADEMYQYQDLIDYTFDSTITTPPEEVSFQGMPVKFDDELVDMTADAFNNFWGTDDIDASNYETAVGSYYLDTTQGPSEGPIYVGTILFLYIIVVLLIFYIILIIPSNRFGKRRKATLHKYGDRLKEIDWELNQADTQRFYTKKLYLTNRYIVSAANGFTIIPYSEIIQVYGKAASGYGLNKHRSIVVMTMEGSQYEIAYFGKGANEDNFIKQIVERIKTVLPMIKYGVDENNFYNVTQTYEKHIETDVPTNGEPVESNVILGIIGAIVGACLGGIIWIIIGKIGFIAGIAGFLIITFAIRGYRMLSGSLDKKGQIISLVIGLIMIFVANYVLTAILYSKYLDGFMTALKILPTLLRTSEILIPFIKDLVIGYLLSIWASIGVLKTIFRRQ